MKNKFLFPSVLIAGLMLISFSVNQVYGQTTQIKPAKQESVMYACPMHPEVVQNKAGTCPKCGMTLVDQKNISKGGDKTKACDSTKMKSGDKKMMSDSSGMKKM